MGPDQASICEELEVSSLFIFRTQIWKKSESFLTPPYTATQLTLGHSDCLDFRKRQQRPYTSLMISGTPVERVRSCKYLGVNISEDLTWTAHIQTQVKKARQRLYHLRQLRKCRVSPAILKTFYSGAIESVLTLAKAELLKLSSTQITPVTVFSFYCHLASASGAWWQKLRDWGGASSLRPSGS